MTKRLHTWWRCMLPLILAVAGYSQAAGAAELKRVLLLQSEQFAPYQRFHRTFEQNLPQGVRLEVRDMSRLTELPAADLVVAVGFKAAQWAVEHRQEPAFATLLTRENFMTLRASRGASRSLSAIYLEQPLSRQVALIRAVLPERKRVGILYSNRTFELEGLRDELSLSGAELVAQPLRPDGSLAGDLEALLAQADILMAIPDGNIFNSSTIRNILLGSYRRGVPMIGLTAAYVNAGALCAVYSTTEQMAAQAAGVTEEFFRNGVLPGAQYPQLYQIDLNQEVARSLRLTVRSVEALRIEVERAEGGRK
ncbi:MAG: hypothetical protein ABII63_01330 [Pseudomonadota bacterium]